MFGLHMAATVFYWYASISWYDMFMHALGGIFLAVFTAAFFMRHIRALDAFETTVTLLLAVLVLGALWEYFEYGVQYVIRGSAELASVSDSVSDLVCDMLGGMVGTYFVLRLKKRYNGIDG